MVSATKVLSLEAGSQCVIIVNQVIIVPERLDLKCVRGSVLINDFYQRRGLQLRQSDAKSIPVVELLDVKRSANLWPLFRKTLGIQISDDNIKGGGSDIEFDETEVMLVYCQKAEQFEWTIEFPKDSNGAERARNDLDEQLKLKELKVFPALRLPFDPNSSDDVLEAIRKLQEARQSRREGSSSSSYKPPY